MKESTNINFKINAKNSSFAIDSYDGNSICKLFVSDSKNIYVYENDKILTSFSMPSGKCIAGSFIGDFLFIITSEKGYLYPLY